MTREAVIGRITAWLASLDKVCETSNSAGKKQVMVAHACHPSNGSLKWKDGGVGRHGLKGRPFLQNNQSKQGWRYGASSRELALQA
jgi:hypothetical protein